MKGFLVLPITFILLLGTPAFADFQKGWDAYQKRDYATALNEWRLLAKQGDATAQFFLGSMYDDGQGVIQDYKAAIKWYKLAAEQGHDYAQLRLGLMYANGKGVLQDYTRAHMWLNIAASQDETAMPERDTVERYMTLTQIEKAQQLARECVAKNFKGC